MELKLIETTNPTLQEEYRRQGKLTLQQIIEWGNEKCLHAPDTQFDYFFSGRDYLRCECPICWKELSEVTK